MRNNVKFAIILELLMALLLKDADSNKRDRGSADFCLFDTFEAKCKDSEVIIIDSALYGRMKVSRCASKSAGQMGCFANVKNIMDRLCSGKQHCEVSVGHKNLLATRPCPGEVAPYLSVSYSCLEVLKDKKNECSRTGWAIVKDDSGYISSVLPHHTPTAKSHKCIWKITSASEKQLNITLHKFSKPDVSKGSPPVCYEALSIKEESNTKTILTCPSDPDVKSVYLSQGSSIEITFPQHSTSDGVGSCIIQFDSVGCAKPTTIKNARVSRKGSSATVRCNKTKESWDLKCKEGQWDGEDRQCSAGWAFASVVGKDSSSQYGMLLIVITGIALGVLIGGFLLYLAINAFKRYHGLLPAQQIQNPSYEKPFYNPNKMAYNDKTIQRSSMIYGTNRRSYPNRQMPPPVPPPHADNPQMRPPSEISEANRQSHIYEMPLFNSL